MTIPDAIAQWCDSNGYTEPHLVEGNWWAFAEGAVMAVPLPDNWPLPVSQFWRRVATPHRFFSDPCPDIMARPINPIVQALADLLGADGVELDPGMLRASSDYMNQPVSADDLFQLAEAVPLAISKLSAATGKTPREILNEPPTVNDVLEIL